LDLSQGARTASPQQNAARALIVVRCRPNVLSKAICSYRFFERIFCLSEIF
jgi:hypothetical protein